MTALMMPGAKVDATQRGQYTPLEIALHGCTSGDTGRLVELAVDWVLANPEPAPLSKPSYRR